MNLHPLMFQKKIIAAKALKSKFTYGGNILRNNFCFTINKLNYNFFSKTHLVLVLSVNNICNYSFYHINIF